MIGLHAIGLHPLGYIDDRHKAIIWFMTVETRMTRIQAVKNEYLVGIGKSAIGLYPLGMIRPENRTVIWFMEIGTEIDSIAATQIKTIKDMTMELTMNKIFPEIEQGGHIFIEVDDNADHYYLSFEGIETE